MEYTIQKLSQLAGVSTRTLRYYDEIDLLKPSRINSSGYRIYGTSEVDKLQQILFYRALDLSLDDIKTLLSSAEFNGFEALQSHRKKLLEKRAELDLLISTVDKTIHTLKGGIPMSDQEKFEGLKKKKLADNEANFGNEIRSKYGKEAVEASNEKFMNMTQSEHDNVTALSELFTQKLSEAFKLGDPASELAQEAADLHRQWLCHFWVDGTYSKEAHYGLAQMYVEDERFTKYYDKEVVGTTQFLKEVIRIYTEH